MPESSGRQDGEEVFGKMRAESRNAHGILQSRKASAKGRPSITFQPVPLATSSLTKELPLSHSDPHIRLAAWLSPQTSAHVIKSRHLRPPKLRNLSKM